MFLPPPQPSKEYNVKFNTILIFNNFQWCYTLNLTGTVTLSCVLQSILSFSLQTFKPTYLPPSTFTSSYLPYFSQSFTASWFSKGILTFVSKDSNDVCPHFFFHQLHILHFPTKKAGNWFQNAAKACRWVKHTLVQKSSFSEFLSILKEISFCRHL